MKKNLFYYLFTVICSVTLFASCSDDDEKVVNPVPQTTFTGENGLQLTYNGAPMLGKKVTFTPDATNAQKATLRLEGEFDLRWVLSIPFFISCIRQQNPLTVLSKIILRKVKQFNLPPPKKNEGFLHF